MGSAVWRPGKKKKRGIIERGRWWVREGARSAGQGSGGQMCVWKRKTKLKPGCREKKRPERKRRYTVSELRERGLSSAK